MSGFGVSDDRVSVALHRRVLRHRVQVTHSLTGQPIPGLTAELSADAPRSWVVGSVANEIVVSGRIDDPTLDDLDLDDHDELDEAPIHHVVIDVSDPVAALYLDLPSAGLIVELDDEIVTATVDPVELEIVVELVDGDGEPRSGQTVTIRSQSGATRTTSEDAERPGFYATEAQVFTSSFARFTVLADGSPVGDASIDPFANTTSVRFVDDS